MLLILLTVELYLYLTAHIVDQYTIMYVGLPTLARLQVEMWDLFNSMLVATKMTSSVSRHHNDILN